MNTSNSSNTTALGIFDGESPSAKETYTMATGDTSYTTDPFYEKSFSSDERTLFVKTADDDESTPTIAVAIQLYNGTGWMTAVTIQTAVNAGSEISVTSYGALWWKKNQGVRFVITKTGAGAVTFTEARWI